MTLEELLLALTESAEINPDDSPKLLAEIADKIDAIKIYWDKLGVEAELFSDYAAEHTATARAIYNRIDRERERVKWIMEQQDFSKLPGRQWRLQIMPRADKLETTQNPTPEIARDEPRFVRRKVSYEWDKEAIKSAIADGCVFGYGKVVKVSSPQFFPNKESK